MAHSFTLILFLKSARKPRSLFSARRCCCSFLIFLKCKWKMTVGHQKKHCPWIMVVIKSPEIMVYQSRELSREYYKEYNTIKFEEFSKKSSKPFKEFFKIGIHIQGFLVYYIFLEIILKKFNNWMSSFFGLQKINQVKYIIILKKYLVNFFEYTILTINEKLYK